MRLVLPELGLPITIRSIFSLLSFFYSFIKYYPTIDITPVRRQSQISSYSVKQIVIVLVLSVSALTTLATLAALPSLAASWDLGLHLYVSVGQSIEEEVSSELLVFVTSEIGLGSLYLAEAELAQSVDGLLFGLRDHDSSWWGVGIGALLSFFSLSD